MMHLRVAAAIIKQRVHHFSLMGCVIIVAISQLFFTWCMHFDLMRVDREALLQYFLDCSEIKLLILYSRFDSFTVDNFIGMSLHLFYFNYRHY